MATLRELQEAYRVGTGTGGMKMPTTEQTYSNADRMNDALRAQQRSYAVPNLPPPDNTNPGGVSTYRDNSGNIVYGNSPTINDLANQFAGAIPEGFAASFNLGDNLMSEAQRLRAERARILEAQRADMLEEQRGVNEQRLGGLTATQKAMTGGELGFSSVELSALQNQQKQNDKSLREINSLIDKAMLDNDENYLANLRQQQDMYLKMRAQVDQELTNRLTRGLALRRESRETSAATADELNNQIANDINILKTLRDIPTGQKVMIGGREFTGMGSDAVDPFFKGSDVVSLMKSLPTGTTQEITDPNTGATYTLVGLATPDPKTKQFTVTDDAGNYRIINFDPTANGGAGAIVGTAVAEGVGKITRRTGTGTGTGGDTIFGKKIKDRTPLYDQSTNQYIADEIQFADGTKAFTDPTGTMSIDVDLANVRRGNPTTSSGGNPVTEDNRDMLRNSFGLDDELIDAMIAAEMSLDDILQ